ncbi:MAG TPA: hypothetical protein VFA54_06815 [Bryobacterales bacterium]|jgi:hypothetical protein|nr:hypothetical protein [Bryobacterales bacterium]
MGYRSLRAISALALVLGGLGIPPPAACQTPAAPGTTQVAANRAPAAATWTLPRTPDGQPDLQGLWTNATLTPFERPKEFAGKEFFTEQEAVEFARRVLDNANRDRRGTTPEADVAGSYNESWFDRGTAVAPTRRTSIVIDPPDGRVPPLTPEARKTMAALAAIRRRPPEGPEDLGLQDRCIIWPTAGPPMVPAGYNNNYLILQTPQYVAILIEMIHDVRIIPLDGRPHLPQSIRQWMGDSRGHWEGDTLVVDTTNFTDKTHFRGSDQNLHLTERFRRTGPDTIEYRFTVDDPTAFTRPWTGEISMLKTPGPIYEYACHEGNYAMTNVLSGARAQEKAAAEAAKKGSK